MNTLQSSALRGHCVLLRKTAKCKPPLFRWSHHETSRRHFSQVVTDTMSRIFWVLLHNSCTRSSDLTNNGDLSPEGRCQVDKRDAHTHTRALEYPLLHLKMYTHTHKHTHRIPQPDKDTLIWSQGEGKSLPYWSKVLVNTSCRTKHRFICTPWCIKGLLFFSVFNFPFLPFTSQLSACLAFNFEKAVYLKMYPWTWEWVLFHVAAYFETTACFIHCDNFLRLSF